MMAPAHNDCTCQFENQSGPAQSPSEGEQHTGGDRVHAAGNGKEPTIQFSTDFLIRLQQHPGRRRHERYGHHKEEAGECGNHPEDDHPYTVSSTERVRYGLSEDPVLIVMLAYLKQAHPKRPVCATADSRATPGRRQDYAAHDRYWPRGDRDELGYRETRQVVRSATAASTPDQ
jgi:hypothetical protein